MPHVLFSAAGDLRPAYEAVDWAATPLGPVEDWSATLRAAVDLMLNTRFPVTLFWGPERVLVYNEAYTALIGEKHPAALGRPVTEVFPEALDTIGPMMDAVLAGRGATWVQDAPVPLVRNGFLEECYFTFSYSPVRDPAGTIEGVLDIAVETTAEVLTRRRLAVLSGLGQALVDVDRVEEIPARILPVLRADTEDFAAVELHGSAGPDDLVIEATAAGRVAQVPVSVPAPGRASLAVRLGPYLAADEDYRAFLRLVARTIGQAYERISAREAAGSLSETLQRSLLTAALDPGDLLIATRYVPAAEEAHVGGDWYDAFSVHAGAPTLVIGDVAGHDRHAAAAMAQVRYLLRGVAYTLAEPPAAVLEQLDRTMSGVTAGLVATAVLAQVEEDADRGGRRLRWSNAGHPPPVLLEPDGSARFLERAADPLLGASSGERTDHTAELPPGSSVVLYTDGLVERRGTPLQDSLDWLVEVLHGRQHLSPEELCDHLLGQLDAGTTDDIALLVVRV